MSTTRRSMKTVLGLALGLALAAPFAASAQAPQGPTGGAIKIAVIDTERILLNSQTGKKALADLKKLQEQKENEAKTKQQEIKDLQTKLNDGRNSLSQDKISEMEKQFEDRAIALKRFQDDANRDLGKKRDEVLAQIDQRVMPVINQVGKELGYTLIFRKFESGLIYADEAVDITNSIIQRLDGAAAAAAPPKQGGK
ncbi:MAG TPA: OmpH family outer membrane protein [Thermoanaerobaculia bacterium]|nr:OmpH family outer membrane protein [Thermoanaerobaculia bacterium]